jgi:hypothetical protein
MIPQAFIYMGNQFWETLYVQVQMLCHYKIVDRIYIHLAQWNLTHPRREQISKLSGVQIVDVTVHPEQQFMGNGGLMPCWLHFFKNHSDYASLSLASQDQWLLEPNRIMRYWHRFTESQKDVMLYHMLLSGRPCIANDMMFMSSEGIKQLAQEDMSDIQSTQSERYFNLLFGSGRYSVEFFNEPKPPWHNYGYCANLGKAHVHHREQKLYYLQMWQEHHNISLDVDLSALEKEHVDHHPVFRQASGLDDHTAIYDGVEHSDEYEDPYFEPPK